MRCCVECFDDEEIIRNIIEQGDIQDCSFCGSSLVFTISTEELGIFIREGFERAYEHVEGFTGAMWDSDRSIYTGGNGEEAGESLLEILYWVHGIFSARHTEESASEILQELIDSTGLTMSDITDGCTDQLSDIFDPCFVTKNDLYGVESTREYSMWEEFKHLCKYYNRYFDIGEGNTYREELLSKLGNIFKLMSDEIGANTVLFRARKHKIELENIDWHREISPAPAKYAVNNRMSPAGISYTYLASHIGTALKEIRATNGENVIIGEFHTKFNLNIVDLTKKIKIKPKSIFSKDYNHGDTWINDFISDFAAEISKPIKDNEKSIEYVATQLLSEYIRKIGYSGIKFESSIASHTYNYVLFCGPNTDILHDLYDYNYYYHREHELAHYNKWLKINAITYIEYEEDEGYKELFYTDTIDEINKSLLRGGRERFINIAEVYSQLKELNEFILNDYYVYKNNELISDFNLIEITSGLIIENNMHKKEMYISVSSGFGFVNISLGVRNGAYRYNSLLSFNCRHKDENILDKIIQPVFLYETDFNS